MYNIDIKSKYYNKQNFQELLELLRDKNYWSHYIYEFLTAHKITIDIVFTDESNIRKYNDMKSSDTFFTIPRGCHTNWDGKNDTITINTSKYDVTESINHIFIHELSHHITNYCDKDVYAMLYSLNCHYYKDLGIDITSKECFKDSQEYDNLYFAEKESNYHYHDKEPLELLADAFATSIIGKDYSIHWFRTRVRNLNKKVV